MKLSISGIIKATLIRGGVIADRINSITSGELNSLSGIVGNVQEQLDGLKQKMEQISQDVVQELNRVKKLYEDTKASYDATKSDFDALKNLVRSTTAVEGTVLSNYTFIGKDGQKKKRCHPKQWFCAALSSNKWSVYRSTRIS